MKSGDTYRFCLSWPMATAEQQIAGEFLNKMGNKKSRFIIQLICDYISSNPETSDPKELVKSIANSSPFGDKLTEIIRSMVQAELSGKTLLQPETDNRSPTKETTDTVEDIADMFDNLDAWDN